MLDIVTPFRKRYGVSEYRVHQILWLVKGFWSIAWLYGTYPPPQNQVNNDGTPQ
jgi:hypothetical protein